MAISLSRWHKYLQNAKSRQTTDRWKKLQTILNKYGTRNSTLVSLHTFDRLFTCNTKCSYTKKQKRNSTVCHQSNKEFIQLTVMLCEERSQRSVKSLSNSNSFIITLDINHLQLHTMNMWLNLLNLLTEKHIMWVYFQHIYDNALQFPHVIFFLFSICASEDFVRSRSSVSHSNFHFNHCKIN